MPKENSTLDEDLYNGLQQARKKKPRYFALIAKGADVVGLIVQKKVINDGAAQKAKSECKGTLVIQGVCCGEGAELKFEVEGKEPTILPKKIKDFIEEQTDLTLKPYWAVVTQMSAVEDEEAPPAATAAASGTPPVVTPSSSSQPPQTANAPPPPPPPPPPPKLSVDVKGLQARLKTLLERNKELVDKNPELREKLQPFTKPAALLVMQGSADAARALDNLEQALNAAQSAAPEPKASGGNGMPESPSQQPASTASEPKATEQKASDPGAEWKQKLAQWLPAIKAAIDAKGPTTDAIRKLFAEASALSKASLMSKPGSDMALAIAKLSECHDLAKAPASPSSADLAAESKRLKAAVYPLVNAAVAENPGQKDAMIRLLGLADKHDKATEYASAIETYQELAALIESLKGENQKAAETSPTADLESLRARWDAARDDVLAQLDEELKWVISTKHQLAASAELELKAVMRQLKTPMDTQQRAIELESYLYNDDVVADVCDEAFDFIPQLLGPLAELRSQLPD